MRLLRDRSGASVLEYGLIAGLVAMIAIAALVMLGNGSESSLNRSASSFPGTVSGGIGTPH